MSSTALENQVSAPPMEPTAGMTSAASVPAALPTEKSSYLEILKSSALMGGSQAINIAIGIARTKAMAIFLGPAGFGLAGLYNSIVDLTQNIAGIGVNSSGVRQIAEAVGSNDEERTAITVKVLRRTSFILGLVGAVGLIVFARQISVLTFGTAAYAAGVATVSIAAFCKLVSGGQGALIQGTRRIADLAKMNVFGALFGAVTGVLLVWAFREKGIVPYVIAIAASSMALSWWYSRKIKTPHFSISSAQIRQEASSLLKLGVAFMISSMMTLGVAYVVRVIVLRKVGMAGTGLYQSAWTLGGLYVGFILQTMAADFYPRLTGTIHDHPTCNRLVNEQALVGLLLAGPGVIATLTFAPLIVAVLYSSKFAASVAILRWICLGAALQVVTWPMGFIIVAKGKQGIFIFCEVAWAVVSVALAWMCIARFGLNGAGIAFFGSYIFHGIMLYPIVHHLSGFCWTSHSFRITVMYLLLIAAVFSGCYYLTIVPATCIGTLAAVASGAYSLRAFSRLLSLEDIPRPLRRAVAMMRVSFDAANPNQWGKS